MNVFAFRHVPFEDVGHIRPVLESRGIGVECVDLYAGAALPELSTAAGLIFMGGPMSANDGLPYLGREIEIIRDAHGRGLPVLGVCLGSQLMARALGGRVYRNSRTEIGWFDLELTAAAASDPLFSGLSRTLPAFHWHGDTFDLPPDATLLASSAITPRQAFRVGAASYGLQFHPEVTPEMIGDWRRQDENCGDVRELDAPIDETLHAAHQRDLSEHLFGNWAALLR